MPLEEGQKLRLECRVPMVLPLALNVVDGFV